MRSWKLTMQTERIARTQSNARQEVKRTEQSRCFWEVLRCVRKCHKMPHQRPPIRRKSRANTGGLYRRKGDVTRRNSPSEGHGCSYRGKIDPCNRNGGLTNILAGAVTAIEPSQPKAVGGKVYQNAPNEPNGARHRKADAPRAGLADSPAQPTT